jgi:hypothetical protein
MFSYSLIYYSFLPIFVHCKIKKLNAAETELEFIEDNYITKMNSEGLLGYAYFENELVILLGKTLKKSKGKGNHHQHYYKLSDGRVKHSSLIKKLSDNEIKIFKRDLKLEKLGI